MSHGGGEDSIEISVRGWFRGNVRNTTRIAQTNRRGAKIRLEMKSDSERKQRAVVVLYEYEEEPTESNWKYGQEEHRS